MKILPPALRISAVLAPQFWTDFKRSSQIDKETVVTDLGEMGLGAIILDATEATFRKPFQSPRILFREDVLSAKRWGADGVFFEGLVCPRTWERAREILGPEKWIGAQLNLPFEDLEKENEALDPLDFFTTQEHLWPAESSGQKLLPTLLLKSAKDSPSELSEGASGVCFVLDSQRDLAPLEKWISFLKTKMGCSAWGTPPEAFSQSTGFQFSKLSSMELGKSSTPVFP